MKTLSRNSILALVGTTLLFFSLQAVAHVYPDQLVSVNGEFDQVALFADQEEGDPAFGNNPSDVFAKSQTEEIPPSLSVITCTKIGMGSVADHLTFFTTLTLSDKTDYALALGFVYGFPGRITQSAIDAARNAGILTAGAAIYASGLVNSCGGGGSGGVSSPATVSISLMSPSTTTNVLLSQQIVMTYTISGGTPTASGFLSSSISVSCGNLTPSDYTFVQNASSVTQGTLVLTPNTTWPAGQVCSFSPTVFASPAGSGTATFALTFTSAPVFNPKIILQLASPSSTGASMVEIDTVTKQVRDLIQFSTAIGCMAGNYIPLRSVRVACSSASNDHFDYTPSTGIVVANSVLPKLPVSVSYQVVSTPDGKDYYGVGRNGGTSPTQSDGQWLIRNGNLISGSIPISNQNENAYPARQATDFAGNAIFSMNDNNSTLSTRARIDRIDLNTGAISATSSPEEKRPTAIAYYNGRVYMSIFRDSKGVDIVAYDSITLARVATGSTTEPLVGGGRYVIALAVDANGVHLGTSNGVQTLSHDLQSVIRTTSLGSSAGHMTTTKFGEICVVAFPTNGIDNVLILNSQTHQVIDKWTISGGPQKPVYIAP